MVISVCRAHEHLCSEWSVLFWLEYAKITQYVESFISLFLFLLHLPSTYSQHLIFLRCCVVQRSWVVASVPFELEDLLGEDLGLGCWVMLMQWFKKQMKQIHIHAIGRVCVLSCFSRVWFFAIPWTIARSAPLSMGFFRQEYWNG